MIRLDDLALFVRTAALGSFSKAAREVNLLPGQASAAIGRLERELDIRLFARSTRSLCLTEEGKRYLPFAQDALDALREGYLRVWRCRPHLTLAPWRGASGQGWCGGCGVPHTQAR